MLKFKNREYSIEEFSQICNESESVREVAEKLGYGGGININGSAILPSNIQLYNNHAPIAGDDIYSTGKITFDSVGSNWILDDCTDTIDDWYYDGYNVMDQKEVLTRWNVDGNEKYIEHYDSSRENQILAIMLAHHIEQNKRGVHVVLIILKRFGNRFANGFKSCKVDNSVNLVVGKKLVHCLSVADVSLNEGHRLANDFGYAVEGLRLGVHQVIHYDHTVASLVQLNDSV